MVALGDSTSPPAFWHSVSSGLYRFLSPPGSFVRQERFFSPPMNSFKNNHINRCGNCGIRMFGKRAAGNYIGVTCGVGVEVRWAHSGSRRRVVHQFHSVMSFLHSIRGLAPVIHKLSPGVQKGGMTLPAAVRSCHSDDSV